MKSTRVCACIAARAAQDKKAENVLVQKVDELTSEVEYVVIASASNARQAAAVVDNIEEEVRTQGGMKPAHREGPNGSTWTLLDYGGFVVHVFLPETRDYYRLEELYNNAPLIDFSACENA